jgi:drug/metabolite transporter (DMT)-like permease
VLAFGAIEMAGPFLLLGHAEQQLPSGTTGLLVATVPLVAAIIAVFRGDRTVLRPLRMLGLVVGFGGVAVIVSGHGLVADPGELLAVGEVLLVAVLYATAPFIVATKLVGVPSLGSITLALAAVGTSTCCSRCSCQGSRRRSAAPFRSSHSPCSARLSRSSPSSPSSARSGRRAHRCSPT